MSKGKLYTLLIFFLSFTVVFCGWFFTEEMLDQTKAVILAKKGEISVEVTEVDSNNNNSVEDKIEGAVLTESEMAKVLTAWDEGAREMFHEPMPGQMNMEQAIHAGRDWINSLSEKNIIPGNLLEYSFDDISAILCSANT